jgi:hypothetical protein
MVARYKVMDSLSLQSVLAPSNDHFGSLQQGQEIDMSANKCTAECTESNAPNSLTVQTKATTPADVAACSQSFDTANDGMKKPSSKTSRSEPTYQHFSEAQTFAICSFRRSALITSIEQLNKVSFNICYLLIPSYIN